MTTTESPPSAATNTPADPATPAPRNPHTAPTAAGESLRRVRWGVRAALTVGVAASVAANILHAEPQLISQIIAAWPPLALLLTVELISRVPVYRRALAAVRLLATAGIAGIAAWVSYFHMAGVVSRYGETGTVPYLLPLSVDGLVIVASISLVELAGRIHNSENPAAGPGPPPARDISSPADVPAEPARPAPLDSGDVPAVRVVDPGGSAESSPTVHQSRPADRGVRLAGRAALPAGTINGTSSIAAEPTPLPAEARATGDNRAMDTSRTPPPTSLDVPAPAPTAVPEPRGPQPSPQTSEDHDSGDEVAARARNDDMPATAAAIADLLRSEPSLQPEDVAVKINRSLRTVRRHWKTAAQARPFPHEPQTRTRDAGATPQQLGGYSPNIDTK